MASNAAAGISGDLPQPGEVPTGMDANIEGLQATSGPLRNIQHGALSGWTNFPNCMYIRINAN